MENAIYWQGRQVGLEMDGRTTWFPSAPHEAIKAYGLPQDEPTLTAADAHIAHNLMKGN